MIALPRQPRLFVTSSLLLNRMQPLSGNACIMAMGFVRGQFYNDNNREIITEILISIGT